MAEIKSFYSGNAFKPFAPRPPEGDKRVLHFLLRYWIFIIPSFILALGYTQCCLITAFQALIPHRSPSIRTFDSMLIQLLISLLFSHLPPSPLKGGKEENTIASSRLCARSSITSSDSLTVYIFLEDECLISQYYTNELTRLYDKYHHEHVGFIGYFPSTTTGPEEIAAFADKFKLDFPLLPDPDKTWTKKFDITITPEVSVLDHRTGHTIYKGRIDDSYVRVGKRKLHPQTHDLEDMIKAWQSNQTQDTLVQTEAIGCFITFTQ